MEEDIEGVRVGKDALWLTNEATEGLWLWLEEEIADTAGLGGGGGRHNVV